LAALKEQSFAIANKFLLEKLENHVCSQTLAIIKLLFAGGNQVLGLVWCSWNRFLTRLR
jgi:hypothetical protein